MNNEISPLQAVQENTKTRSGEMRPSQPFHKIKIVDNTTTPPTVKEGCLDVVDGAFVLVGDFTADEFKRAFFELQSWKC